MLSSFSQGQDGRSSEEAIDSESTILSAGGRTLEQIKKIQKEFFLKNKTRPWKFRDRQLQLLFDALRDHKEEIITAVQKDLGRPYTEAFVTEVGFILDEIRTLRRGLKKWMKPKKIFPGLLILPGRAKIVREPVGQVLVIAPWNYPFQLGLTPLVGALAAGNCCVIKPSEYTPHSTKVMREILTRIFSEEYVAVFEGGPATSGHLLEKPWDHIFFTGSTKVGRVIAEKAAKTLSPATLELGGKSPCIIDETCNLKLAAKRVMWGKFFNTGQTCVAPDYLIIHKSVKDKFLKLCVKNIEVFFGKNPSKSPDYGRIVSKQHTERLASFLELGKVHTGGIANISDRYLSPTIIEALDTTDKLMTEEIFGPILPVITYEDLDHVVEDLNKKDRPLALYLFSKDQDSIDKVMEQTSFGGGCINDVVMHLANHNLPFGGIGNSGFGRYHGEYSFNTFSHHKSIVTQSSWLDIPARYPPLGAFKRKLFEFIMG